jgi:7-cyano-7-deazaguanine synthase in queuosine biosynthesis
MNLSNFKYRIQPWKDPERDFIEHDQSLIREEGAERAGILHGTICLPDMDGIYQAYDERGIMVNGWVTGYRSDETDCPRFRKCADCPNRSAAAVLRIVHGEGTE